MAEEIEGRVERVLLRDTETIQLLNDTVIKLRVTAAELERITKELADGQSAE